MEGVFSVRIKDGFILKEVADNYVVVPVGENLVDFHVMITLNETGAFLWNLLTEETTSEALAEALASEYQISVETALEDVNDFISTLKERNLLA